MQSNAGGTPKWAVIVGYFILPLFVNVFYVLFIAFCFSPTEPMSYIGNILGIVAVIFFYLAGLALFIVFFVLIDEGGEFHHLRFGLALSILMAIGYPLVFLISLPVTIFYLFCFFGSPKAIWEKWFSGKAPSLENLHYDPVHGYCFLALNFIWIGLLFGLFSLLYFLFVICLCPLWFFFFSPFGFGGFGCAIYRAIRHKDGPLEELNSSNETFCIFSIAVTAFAYALPALIFGIVFLVIGGITWFAICLVIFSGLYFLVFGVLSLIIICNKYVKQVV